MWQALSQQLRLKTAAAGACRSVVNFQALWPGVLGILDHTSHLLLPLMPCRLWRVAKTEQDEHRELAETTITGSAQYTDLLAYCWWMAGHRRPEYGQGAERVT